ncbi:4-alpha-glucanotransferase [Cystobacter fuscus]
MGPQGQTTEDNPSPYDGTLFSRNVLNVALGELMREEPWGALLRPERVRAVAASRPGGESRVPHRHVFRVQEEALEEAWETFQFKRAQAQPGGVIARVAERFEDFQREHAQWLERDALYDVLCLEHGRSYWREWSSEWDRRLWNPRPSEEGRSPIAGRCCARSTRRGWRRMPSGSSSCTSSIGRCASARRRGA